MAEYSNREFKDPIQMSESELRTGTLTLDYSLSQIEFEKIQRGSSKLHSATISLFFVGVGYFVPLAPKFLKGGIADVSTEEWKVLGGISLLVVTLYLISLCIPNDKSKVMKDIRLHFEGNKPTKHTVRGSK